VVLSALLGIESTGCSSDSTGAGLLKSTLGAGDGGTGAGSSGGGASMDASGDGADGASGPAVDGGSGPGAAGGPGSGLDDASDLGSGDASEGGENPDGATATCNAFTADGPLVGQTALSGSQPTAMGGHIYSGTYWLTERDTYGGAPDGVFVQRTLVVGDTTIGEVGGESAGDAGMPAWTTTTSSYEVLDLIVLSATESCPGPPHVTNVQFTAVSGQLMLYPTADTAEVYTLQ
jgi:hypothetical protein